jgi:NAD(P)-dependent dehydrogenase (short-subunit alcohol dehydrogenase family)
VTTASIIEFRSRAMQVGKWGSVGGLHFRGNSVHVMTVDGGDPRGKARVATLTRAIAHRCAGAGQGVRANALLPGSWTPPCCASPRRSRTRGALVSSTHQLGLLSPLMAALPSTSRPTVHTTTKG